MQHMIQPASWLVIVPRAVCAAGACVLVLAACGGGESAVSCNPPVPEPGAWSRAGEAMTREARRIAECGVLIGLRVSEVRHLLGPESEGDAQGIAYELGPDSWGVDSMYLDVKLDDGRVVGADLYQG